MATTTQAATDWQSTEGRLLLHDVGWNDYEAMLEIVGERHIRVTFDRGTMEVTMPSQRHEQAAQVLGSSFRCLPRSWTFPSNLSE